MDEEFQIGRTRFKLHTTGVAHAQTPKARPASRHARSNRSRAC